MQDPAIQAGLALAGFEPATAVTELPLILPGGLGLAQNSPNPFRGWTSISYDLPAATEVSLDLFDVAGRRIRTLDRGPRSAGPHQVRLDAQGLPAGIYYYRIRAGENWEGKRCTVVR